MAGEIQLNSVTLATESGGVASIDSSVNIKGPLNASGSAPIYACRAWVNFNGTGTVAIRESGNVSSITDNGAGDYTVNFTTAMPDANYCCVTNLDRSNSDPVTGDKVNTDTRTTTSVKVYTTYNANGGTEGAHPYDSSQVDLAVFR